MKIFKFKFEIILGVSIVSYIILFSYLSIHRMYALNSHYYDLGIMNQTVHNTSRGFFLEMTDQQSGKNVSRLAIHFDPILAGFAPIYWFYPGPEVLLIGQTLVLASGALAVFLVARKILKRRLMSLVFALSYLLFFQVERANLFDFHAVTLATGFLSWMIYFSLLKRWAATFIFVFLALLTKEHVGLIIFLYGSYLFFIHKDKKIGFSISFLGGLFFILTTFVIIPYFRESEHFAMQYYSNLSKISFFEIKDYLIRLLSPHFFYLIFSPLEFLISLPEVLINSLSSNDNMRSYYFHYSSLIVPFIFFSAICGAAKIEKTKYKYIALFLFIFLNFRSVYRFNPLPYKFLKKPYDHSSIDQTKLKIIKNWQKNLVDNEIKVATTPKLAPFFTNRHYFINYDATYRYANISRDEIVKAIDSYNQANYVIINKEEIGNLNKASIQAIFYKDLLNNRSFEMVFNQDGIEVFKKI